ncbi:ubiquitin carboxyl-terminal hydrolase MINDY-1 [Elysia marginata]|uniref:Ubiquitin carboxyl-terminal hydrolase n=1 Tax=Elysia marginata TaxID=1093978 RepID=A0AAV4J9X7_9GAST|nr:ubiquitin carboxyl-terminal hydrolase MINDY-1 [Elysia marginata]
MEASNCQETGQTSASPSNGKQLTQEKPEKSSSDENATKDTEPSNSYSNNDNRGLDNECENCPHSSSMDQQVSHDQKEVNPCSSQELQEGNQSFAETRDKPEHDGKTGAEDVQPTAGDSGCQIEDVSSQPLAALYPEDNNTVSSGESSPVSSQGQDSGLSPDEAILDPVDDHATPVSCGNKAESTPALKERKLSDSVEDKHPKPCSEEAKPAEVVSPSGHTSPEGSSGMSETQVTVSDLDSPSSPVPQTGGATAIAEDSGATACASDTVHVSSTATAASPSPAASKDKEMESVYYIKWITFDGSSVPIITQNENGPCPLLALVNVLLLKGKVKLAPMLEMITSEQLMTYLGECILENTPKDLPETTQANYEQNMQDAMGVMHKLQTGLDVNVKFTGVRDFEYTPELIVFDLLGISLFHGWLVDPQDKHTVEAVNQCSYNQLVEKIILLKHSDKEEMVTQALTAEQFLERSASQLTYHGLAELSSVVKENELCVFFRNNHFNSLYRHNSELFLLVTDQGFLTESQVVWETLSNVEGDCHFTDSTFRTYTKPAPSTEPILPDPNVAVGSPEQIDHDHDLAMRLQEEENRREALQAQHASGPPQPPGYQYPHQQQQQQQQQQQWARHPGHHTHQHPQAAEGGGQRRRGDRRDREDKSCIIL